MRHTKMNKIARTFVLVGVLVCILLAFHLLPKVVLDDTELRKVSILSDILPEAEDRDASDEPVVAEIVDSLDEGEGDEADDSSELVAKNEESPKNDAKDPKAETKKEEPVVEEISEGEISEEKSSAEKSSADKNHPVVSTALLKDFSNGAEGGMYHFFNSLKNNAKKRPVRIAYFGDSFIEGDIMTCDLREMLQSKFGGSGVGWVDCKDRLNGFRKTVKQKSSGVTEYANGMKTYDKALVGINQRYFVPTNSAQTWVGASKEKKHLDQWQRSSIYLKTANGVSVSTTTNKEKIGPKTIKGSSQVQVVNHDGNGVSEVGFQFSNVSANTYLYGMALESKNGVILDNFSFRGSSGVPLGQIPEETLSDFAKLRPYDLIVLHYGLNMTSDKAPLSVYQSYTKRMVRVINHLREAYPHTSILVVSIPDRCQRTGGEIKSLKSVETMVKQQQAMASNGHVSFFNLYSAMGGKDSMKSMVSKGMAGKDYTHITFAGGKQMAQYLYNGLMEGYDKYEKGQK